MFNENQSCSKGRRCWWGLCLMGAAAILSYGMYQSAFVIKQKNAYLNVVGAAEKVVLANQGVLEIHCVIQDKEAEFLHDKMQVLLLEMQTFLANMKVKSEEVQIYNPEYETNTDGNYFRKTMIIKITSSDVKYIDILSKNAMMLLNKESWFKFSKVMQPKYYYKGLEVLKKELLPNAIQNAYKCAADLTKGTKQKVGEVLSIRQGYVSDYNDYNTINEMNKTAKMVVDVSFSLE